MLKKIFWFAKCSYKLLRRTALATKSSKDKLYPVPLTVENLKKTQLESKALEYTNRAYNNLNKACFTVFIGQWAIL
jgi:hypothetical protein